MSSRKRKAISEGIEAGASTSSSINLENPGNKDCERNHDFNSRSHPGKAESDSESYIAGGIKNAVHGVSFQGKIILRLVSRSLDCKIDFTMATEMEAADKFDDVVIFFKEENETTAVFVQAKHRLYPERDKIQYNDLMVINGDFTLTKYFLSFNKIMNDPQFNSNKKKFVICTNTGFDLDSFSTDILSPPRDIDTNHQFFIDDTWFTGTRGKIYTINNENDAFIDELKKEVRKSVLLKIKKSKSLQQLLQDHPNKEELYKRINNLYNKLDKSENKSKRTNTLNEEYPMESDWNEIKQHLNEVPETADVKELLSLVDIFLLDTILTEGIASFFEHLEFITEYPNEKQLDDILKKELILKPEIKEINNLFDPDLLYSLWQKNTFEWLHRYEDVQNKVAKFKNNIDWGALLDKLRDKSINTVVSSLSKANIEKLKTFPIEFNEEFEELNDFLKSNEQVCCLKTTWNNPRLATIKTVQHLDRSKLQRYIFTSILDIHVEWLSNLIIRSFTSTAHFNLLVVECSPEENNITEDQFICSKISDILQGNNQKKVLVIGSTESYFERKLKRSFSGRSVNINDSFKDFTVVSQNKILQMTITFQGQVVCLYNLMDNTLASEILDQHILMGLLEKKIDAVGNQLFFCNIGYNENVYVTRNFQKSIEFSNNTMESSRKYFITGITTMELAELGFKTQCKSVFFGLNFYNNGIILCPDETFPDNSFCSSYLRDKFHDKKFNYCLTTSEDVKMDRLLYDRTRKAWIELVREEDFYKPDKKTLLIASDSGTGKSTVLANIALGIKKQCRSYWVIRIDLNNFTGKGKGSLQEIDFEEDDINEAVEFLISMVFRDDSSKFLDFPRKLLKETFKGRKESKLKTIVMFDGFDEISPLYKEKTIKLIRGIQASNASQIIVTTRLNEMNNLERELNTRAWMLAPFRRCDQVEYLNRFFKLKLSPRNLNKLNKKENDKLCSEDYLFVLPLFNKLLEMWERITYAPGYYSDSSFDNSHILIKFKNSSEEYENMLEKFDFTDNFNYLIHSLEGLINDHIDFLSTPLILKIFADVMIGREFEIIPNMQIMNLYDSFVNIKFKIYNKEKRKQIYENQVTESIDMFLEDFFEKMYHHLAFNLFFPNNTELSDLKKEIEKWENKYNLKRKKLRQEISRAGIVTYQTNGQLQFIHRSFAEYYLSKCLCEYLGNNLGIQQLFVREMLPNENKYYSGALDFINSQLYQNKVELTVVTDEITFQHIKDAAGNRYGGIVLFLLDCLKYKDSNGILIRNLISHTNNDKGTILHYAAHHSILSYKLLTWFKENLADSEYCQFLLTKNKYKQTFFYIFMSQFISSSGNHKDVLEFLISVFGIEMFTKQLVFERSYNSQSILQITFNILKVNYEITIILKKFDVILDFLTKKLDQSHLRQLVLLKDTAGETILHTVARKLHASHICEFLNSLKDKIGYIVKELILKKNKRGQTILNIILNKISILSISEYSLQLLEKILILLKAFLNLDEFRKLVFMTDENGESILHHLLRRSPIDSICDTLDYLKDKTGKINKEILVENKKGQTILHYIAKYFNLYSYSCCRPLEVSKLYGNNNSRYKHCLKQPCQNLVLLKKIITYLNCCLHPRDFEYLVLRKDVEGNTMLYNIAQTLSIIHVCDLLNYLKQEIGCTNKLILESNKEGKTILHVIVEQGYSCCRYKNVKEPICFYADSLKEILTFLELNLNKSDFEMLLLAKDVKYETILNKLVRSVSIPHMTNILNFLKDKFKCLLKKLILNRNTEEPSILHTALERYKSNHLFDHLSSYKPQDGFKLEAILNFLNNVLNIEEFENLVLVKDEKNEYVKVGDIVYYRGGNGKNILHMIGSELSVSRICKILNLLKRITEYNNKLLFSKDKQENTILHATINGINYYSIGLGREKEQHVICHKVDCIKEILTFFNSYLNPIDFKELLEAENTWGENILHLTAQYLPGSYFCDILNFLKDILGNMNQLLLARNKRGQTLLHVAEQRFYSDHLKVTNIEEDFFQQLDFLHKILTCLKGCLNPTDFEQLSFASDMWGRSVFNTIFHFIKHELEQC